MKDFLKAAREMNLSKGQAAKVLETYQSMLQNALTPNAQAVEKAVKENSKSLIDEFGTEAAAWWKKAVTSEKGLQAELARTGLTANKALMRALVLLGRETSEESTPDGNAHGNVKGKTWAEGGKLSFSYAK